MWEMVGHIVQSLLEVRVFAFVATWHPYGSNTHLKMKVLYYEHIGYYKFSKSSLYLVCLIVPLHLHAENIQVTILSNLISAYGAIFVKV